MYGLKLTDEVVQSNSVIFSTGDGDEALKLCDNGDIFIKGKLIENDKEVVDAMREFLKIAGFIKYDK